MTREEKSQVIQDLTVTLARTNTIYLADISGLDALTPGVSLTIKIKHEEGNSDEISVGHTLNEQEIQWFYHGSALNYVGSQK